MLFYFPTIYRGLMTFCWGSLKWVTTAEERLSEWLVMRRVDGLCSDSVELAANGDPGVSKSAGLALKGRICGMFGLRLGKVTVE